MSDPWAFGWTQLLTLTGFAITILIAIGGFRSFGRWRREKLEERRIDVAIDALAIAYEAKFVFGTIRSRGVGAREYEDATEPSNMLPGARVELREGQRGAYAVMKRIEGHAGFFEKVTRMEPRFMAVFESETENIFASLYGARRQLAAAAEDMFDISRLEHDDERTKSEKKQLREFIFRGWMEDKKDDKIGDLVDGFWIQIETICRPIIDQRYGKPTNVSKTFFRSAQ